MDEKTTINVIGLLGNLSNEAGRLARVAGRLDTLVGDIVAENGAIPNAWLQQLQEVDQLRQALEALQQVTLNGAVALPLEHDAELPKAAIAQGVKLEAVRVACLDGPVEKKSGSSQRTRNAGEPAMDFF